MLALNWVWKTCGHMMSMYTFIYSRMQNYFSPLWTGYESWQWQDTFFAKHLHVLICLKIFSFLYATIVNSSWIDVSKLKFHPKNKCKRNNLATLFDFRFVLHPKVNVASLFSVDVLERTFNIGEQGDDLSNSIMAQSVSSTCDNFHDHCCVVWWHLYLHQTAFYLH